MNSASKRSYLGIGSCVLFGIAAGSIAAVYIANIGAQHKMAGLESIIVIPFALLLNVIGSCMGAFGLTDRAANPLSRTGLFFNLLPLLVVAVNILRALLVGH